MVSRTTNLTFSPLPLPPSADPSAFSSFGRICTGFVPGEATKEQIEEIHQALYLYGLLLFKGLDITPKEQYELTKSFDPTTQIYGHGPTKPSDQKTSILHPDLKTIPHQPQVQLIGNGLIDKWEGLEDARLKHPNHRGFHKVVVSEEDEKKGFTRFYRWHIDAALYDLSPPKVTTLYAVRVPGGDQQVCRYDDGTGDELVVPLGTTAFVSGVTMFDVLPKEFKSLAVRTRVQYAPHPYVWMSKAKAKSTGLGIEDDNLELPLSELPKWTEEKLKILPVLWKNPVTGKLHFQVHPCGAHKLHIDPLPKGIENREGALYPDGGVIDDLKTVREILYKMQRPGIAPSLVYPVDWEAKDLALFHNRGVLHSVVGAFEEDQVRMFHQCNLASNDDPLGPSEEDIAIFA